jgi:hypothetical protein
MLITKPEISKFIDSFEKIKMSGGSYYLRRKGGLWDQSFLPKELLRKLVEEAYKSSPAIRVVYDNREYLLMDKTSTIAIYKIPHLNNQYIISVRGTKLSSISDLGANIKSLFGKTSTSDRYKEDEAEVIRFIRKYPNAQLIFASHSLGSNIVKNLLKVPIIRNHTKYALHFNPSFQLSELFSKPDINKNELNAPPVIQHNVVSSEDPLFKIQSSITPEIAQNHPDYEIKKEEKNPSLLEAHTIENTLLGTGIIPDEIKEKFKKMKNGIYKNTVMIKYMKDQGIPIKKSNNGIKKWFNESWVNVDEYLKGNIVPCGRKSVKNKEAYPICRPLKRFDKTTPPTIVELTAIKSNIPKLKKMIKAKEKNPKIRLNFKELV